MRTIFTKYQLPLFFLLSCLLSWWAFPPLSGVISQSVAITAAIVIALTMGRTSLREWWNRLTTLRRLAIPILILAILSMTLNACASSQEAAPITVPAGAKAGDLVNMAACTYTAHDVEYKADCGTLVVPENRSKLESRLIALPVTRVHALNDNPAEPIFFFQGGPGLHNRTSNLEGIIDNHDFVIVGYRGADGSVVLECPEISEAIRNAPSDMLSDAALDSYTVATRQCAERLQSEGIDLAGYTITETIDDMEAARAALGYDKINLLGQSYGTRVEIIYEQRYHESLKRVVMVAVNPPGHLMWDPKVTDAQIEDYGKLCAKDAQCSARTGDLAASMRHVSETMPDRWLIFPIDKGAVKATTFVMLFETIQPPDTPVPLNAPAAIDMWLAAEKGDYSGIAFLSMGRNAFLPNLFVWGHFLSLGGSVKDYRDRSPEFVAGLNPPGSVLGSPASYWYMPMVPGWPDNRIPEEYEQVHDTEVETLLISGNLDFACPAQFASDELLPHLRNGHHVILEDLGHVSSFYGSQPEARARLLTTYFNTGEVDTSLYTYQPVNFDAGLGWPGLAKVMLAIVVLVVALLAALVWSIVRWVRRRRPAS